jgi:hypothetical protein
MPKRIAKIAGVVLGLLLLLGGGLLVASETMEVVVLTSYDDSGAHETRLWVVDNPRGTWLRCGDRERAWCRRVGARPEVLLRRNGETRPHLAVVVDEPDTIAHINARMRKKYGLTDLLILKLERTDDPIAVRLEPRER